MAPLHRGMADDELRMLALAYRDVVGSKV